MHGQTHVQAFNLFHSLLLTVQTHSEIHLHTVLSVSLRVWFLAKQAAKTVPNTMPYFVLTYLIQYLRNVMPTWFAFNYFCFVFWLENQPASIYALNKLFLNLPWRFRLLNILLMTLKEKCYRYKSYKTICFMAQEAAGGAGGSPHAERRAHSRTAARPTQQLRWPGSGTGGSLFCPGDTQGYSKHQHCLMFQRYI